MRIPYPPFNDKRYILNTHTGVAHDLDAYCSSCLIYNMNPDHVFASDYFYTEIKEHPAFKELCDYCMTPDD